MFFIWVYDGVSCRYIDAAIDENDGLWITSFFFKFF